MQIFLTFTYQRNKKINKIQIKKEEIKELTKLYIPEMTGLRNLSKQKKQQTISEILIEREKTPFRIQSNI